MIAKLAPMAIAIMLMLTGCSNSTSSDSQGNDVNKPIYSNLVDKDIQQELKNTLIKNSISEQQSDYFIKLVQEYNEKTDLQEMTTSNYGFTTINTQ